MVVPIPEDVPPGAYDLWVGLYETESQGQARLPVTGSGEFHNANSMVNLGTVTVGKK